MDIDAVSNNLFPYILAILIIYPFGSKITLMVSVHSTRNILRTETHGGFLLSAPQRSRLRAPPGAAAVRFSQRMRRRFLTGLAVQLAA